MSDNVKHLGDKANSNRYFTPEQILEEALNDLRTGSRDYNKVLILTLDDRGQFTVGWYAAQLKASEILALCHRGTHLMQKLIDGGG